MSGDVLVQVEGVSKKFCRSLKRSLWYGVQDVSSELLGRKAHRSDLRDNEFWAIDNVSFELRRGECLGLIGPNGAGKSTLLKILNGLIKPDRGRVTTRGRIGALIELGAGFSPILTARENIYVNGSVLGFTKSEVDRKFDEIVNFAEIEEFIDTPVQGFSSGMKVRLGFAIAAQMDPDVLMIDEILAVGDAAFRTKCINQIEMLSKRSAIIFVSHSMPLIGRMSDRALLLSHGAQPARVTSVPEAIAEYFSVGAEHSHFVYGGDNARLLAATFSVDGETREGNELEVDQFSDLELKLTMEMRNVPDRMMLNLGFLDQEEKLVFETFSSHSDFFLSEVTGKTDVTVAIGKVLLNPGVYHLSIGLIEYGVRGKRGSIVYLSRGLISLRVRGKSIGYSPVQFQAGWAVKSCAEVSE